MEENEFDILAGLNKAQLEAVTETESYVRVLAGAGSERRGLLATGLPILLMKSASCREISCA
ncbi:putative ATP-dependent DNA helicase N-terminal region fragment (plasmid) [Selenomonas ruminantium subsp. lactilytica TAM6421]|uniref:Putative ATP-dependent DNA helicase N-terminal region n=1 Tax=Selenomonas ruminantium subsp. lactilytica (strain NBRC 103574 / TAM6421) TaxID=927704 RepID=I0GW18_SELRL|nr:putative ATP-dependent DNA helicase N-terminal region fragment [Selenomonas ruminantium subsp. lactilytica TAM6421]